MADFLHGSLRGSIFEPVPEVTGSAYLWFDLNESKIKVTFGATGSIETRNLT